MTINSIGIAIEMKIGPKWSACATRARAINRPRQDGQENRHPAQSFVVGERAGCQQAPVLGRQDLQPGGRRGVTSRSSRRNFGRHVSLLYTNGHAWIDSEPL